MLLVEDVWDDLIWAYPDMYSREGGELIYQNGKDNPKYVVRVEVIWDDGRFNS